MSATTASPKPFTISIPSNELTQLQQKLSTTRFPDELDEAGWNYGVPLADIKRLVAYWQNGFDWRKHEAQINAALPQYTIDIPVEGFGSLNVHFVHKRSDRDGAIPLLFVHGGVGPGSFLEVAKILPLLTSSSSNESPSFHVVTYSLPGYGFSEGPRQTGFAARQYAEIGHKLMLTLGYNEYVTQGGDWGYVITRKIGQLYGGKHCKASHTNMNGGEPPRLLKKPLLYLKHALTPYTASEKAGFARSGWFRSVGNGYFIEQSTQPQTLGYSLGDSPVGLLAWIYEKLVNWTDSYPWTDDEILTWISIYWFSRAGPAASVRIYYEVAKARDWSASSQNLPPNVPLGMSYFPKELFIVPHSWVRSLAHVVFLRHHASGGHFAAHEKPEELVGDLRDMFGRGGPAFGVVKGNDGYVRSAHSKL